MCFDCFARTVTGVYNVQGLAFRFEDVNILHAVYCRLENAVGYRFAWVIFDKDMRAIDNATFADLRDRYR